MRLAGRKRAIVLVDGEHHPAAVGDALSDLAADREITGVVFCGGGEKVAPAVLADPGQHYGYPLVFGDDPEDALTKAISAGEADVVIDLADEPVVTTAIKLRLAAVAAAAGLEYEAPGLYVDPLPLSESSFPGPKIAVIGTAKRTGKTAVCGHLATLLRERGAAPAIVSMGRGGPAVPQIAMPPVTAESLLALAREGVHAASDYLEDALLAGVPTVGCRRVGGGPSGATAFTNFPQGVEAAAAIDGVDTLLFEGSGATLPPVRADRTICVVGSAQQAADLAGPLRLAVSDLVLVWAGDAAAVETARRFSRGRVQQFEMIPEPLEPPPAGARVAVFTTAAGPPASVEPVFASRNLARRVELADDLAAAEAAGCDYYLMELKAAAIDMVAEHAVRAGRAVGFIRNRPVADDAEIDDLLFNVWQEAAQ